MKVNNQPHAALDHTTRFRWEDGWRDLIRDTRIPDEVPKAAPERSRTWRYLNDRRRAEQERRAYEALPERHGVYSTKAHDGAHGGHSDYLGVFYRKTTGMYEAVVTPTFGGTQETIGVYDTEEDAARARDRAVIARGYGSPLNFDRHEYEGES